MLFRSVTTASDHVPLLFQIRDQVPTMRGFKRSFKFENMWTKDDLCSKVVEVCWKEETIGDFIDFARTVTKCGEQLMRWNKDHYGHLQSRINSKKQELDRLMTRIQDAIDNVTIEECRK